MEEKKPNAWGIYDMLGNIYEWCNDWYDDYSLENVVDPKGGNIGEQRVLRGGSWDDAANCCRSAYRDCEIPEFKSNLIGFRVALVPIR